MNGHRRDVKSGLNIILKRTTIRREEYRGVKDLLTFFIEF